jgi:hypothetical protein
MKTFLCSHLVTLRWNSHKTFANLEKISPALATVNAEEAVPVGTAVSIAAGVCHLAGTVVSCEADRFGNFMDVALEAEWSPQQFTPDHLFDPDVLV